jgi:hypothetical protein
MASKVGGEQLGVARFRARNDHRQWPTARPYQQAALHPTFAAIGWGQ